MVTTCLVDSYFCRVTEIAVEPILRSAHILADSWHIVLFLVLLVIMAWAKRYFGVSYLHLVKNAFTANFGEGGKMDDGLGVDFYSVLMNGLFVFNLAFVLYQVDIYYNIQLINLSGLPLLAFYALAVVVVYGVKLLVYYFNGYVFNADSLMQYYTNYLYQNFRSLGLILFPVNVLISYADVQYGMYAVYFFFGVFAVFWLLRLVHGMLLGMQANVSLAYLFLYLCTLEILPVLVLVKLGFAGI